MRRVMAITAFALVLALPVWAQHGGGGHGGGFGGGHAAGHSGFGGSSHVGAGSLAGSRASGVSRSLRGIPSSPAALSRTPFLHDGFRGAAFRSDRFRTGLRDRDRFRFGFRNGFRNNCFGYVCRYWGYPWGWGYWDPWLWDWWNSDSRYNQDDEQNLALAEQINEQNLREQRLLEQEQADGDRDLYARSAAPRPQEYKQTAPVPDTVLVFRDQHKQEVQNYAIVGHTLWAFAPQHTQKIPLADLDLAATTKANDDRGVTFSVPSAIEAR